MGRYQIVDPKRLGNLRDRSALDDLNLVSHIDGAARDDCREHAALFKEFFAQARPDLFHSFAGRAELGNLDDHIIAERQPLACRNFVQVDASDRYVLSNLADAQTESFKCVLIHQQDLANGSRA